jgi:hypothetical protein
VRLCCHSADMTTDLTCITGRRLNRASSKWILMDIHETIYLLLRVPLSRYLLTSRFRHFGLDSDKTRTVEARYFFIPLVCSLSQRIFLRNLFSCFQQEAHDIAPRLPMQCTGACMSMVCHIALQQTTDARTHWRLDLSTSIAFNNNLSGGVSVSRHRIRMARVRRVRSYSSDLKSWRKKQGTVRLNMARSQTFFNCDLSIQQWGGYPILAGTGSWYTGCL